MRPTRRAVAVAGLCGLAVWLAVRFGARSLNAVVVPALVALVAGAIQLVLADRPTVRRSRPAPGFPNEVRAVELTVEGGDALSGRITETVGDGLESSFSSAKRGLPATVEYDVRLGSRGERRLGPATLKVTDVLGLWTTTYDYPKRTPLLVYPALFEVAGAGGALGAPDPVDQRDEFDELREYVPGDSLRDIHWASSAKRDDLVVMEFDTASDVTGLTVAAEAVAGYDDEMAAATASVVTALLDAGLAVGLALPETEVERDGGESQRERVLAALARTGPGRVERDADVRVVADAGGTRVTVENREIAFSELAGPRIEPTADAGVVS